MRGSTTSATAVNSSSSTSVASRISRIIISSRIISSRIITSRISSSPTALTSKLLAELLPTSSADLPPQHLKSAVMLPQGQPLVLIVPSLELKLKCGTNKQGSGCEPPSLRQLLTKSINLMVLANRRSTPTRRRHSRDMLMHLQLLPIIKLLPWMYYHPKRRIIASRPVRT